MKVDTGVPGLDAVLYDGLPEGRLYLIQGEPGTGKTTFALQFLQAGRDRGESVLYVTLSETADELRSAAASHGWSLDGIKIFELSAAEQLTKMELEQTVFHPAEVELTETTKALLKMVDEMQPSRVVFDTLSEMRLLAGEALLYRRQILILKQYLSNLNATVLFLDDDLAASKDMQSMVNGVIELDTFVPEFGTIRRRLRVLKMRGTSFLGGYHDFQIWTGGITVFPRLVASDTRSLERMEVLSTGDENFDKLLGGGLDTGASVLIMGSPGSGKSSITASIALAAANRNVRSAFFVFDERPTTLFARSRSLGLPLQEAVDAKRVTVQQVDPAELSPGEFVHAVRSTVEAGARIVVIDSILGYLNAMPEDRYLVLQLHELLTYLGQAGVTSLLVLGVSSRAPTLLSSIDISYLADTVISASFDVRDSDLQRRLAVYKRRAGNHEAAPRSFQMTSEGLKFGEPIELYNTRSDV